jgi:hypothetical protein
LFYNPNAAYFYNPALEQLYISKEVSVPPQKLVVDSPPVPPYVSNSFNFVPSSPEYPFDPTPLPIPHVVPPYEAVSPLASVPSQASPFGTLPMPPCPNNTGCGANRDTVPHVQKLFNSVPSSPEYPFDPTPLPIPHVGPPYEAVSPEVAVPPPPFGTLPMPPAAFPHM